MNRHHRNTGRPNDAPRVWACVEVVASEVDEGLVTDSIYTSPEPLNLAAHDLESEEGKASGMGRSLKFGEIRAGHDVTRPAKAAQIGWGVLVPDGAVDDESKMCDLSEISHPVGQKHRIVDLELAMKHGSRRNAGAARGLYGQVNANGHQRRLSR